MSNSAVVSCRARLLFRSGLAPAALGLVLALGAGACGERTITLHGAVQFSDDHPFNRTLLELERLTKAYYGEPVEFVLHRKQRARAGEGLLRVSAPGPLG